MIAVGVLAVSIVLQLTAAGLALRLVRVTGWWLAGVFVSAALVLMSLRRCITLYRVLAEDRSLSPDLTAELVALCISVLMVTGVALIGPLSARAKKMERDLRHSEARLRQATELAGLGYWLWDAVEDKCIHCSEQHARIHGVSVDEYLARSASFEGDVAFTHPDDRDEYRKVNLEALATGTGFDMEYRLLTPAGETRYVHELGQPVFDDAGSLVQFYGTIQDITERRRAEEEIRKLNRVLERRVEERTTELHAARDALVRNERLAALGQLIGMVAHELRNPLGAIATSFDVIQNKCEAAKLDLDRALGRAERNIKRCDDLISELLEVTHAKVLQPEPTVLDAWLSDLLEEQRIPESITLSTDLDAEGAAVAFDREQVRRAVINLVDNACQAMAIDGDRDGTGNGAGNGKQLTVATRRTDGRIEIEVADTGPGIPEDDLTKVLEPLFTTKSCGTGLGLAIVQRIVERHNGGLEITSEKRRGTRVRLWLPTDHGLEEAAPR
jgi:PAS domain S-box-containing protein